MAPQITLDLGLFTPFDAVFSRRKGTMRGVMQLHRALNHDGAPAGCARSNPIVYGFSDFHTEPRLRQALDMLTSPPRASDRNAHSLERGHAELAATDRVAAYLHSKSGRLFALKDHCNVVAKHG